jgi:hypothetical protein
VAEAYTIGRSKTQGVQNHDFVVCSYAPELLIYRPHRYDKHTCKRSRDAKNTVPVPWQGADTVRTARPHSTTRLQTERTRALHAHCDHISGGPLNAACRELLLNIKRSSRGTAGRLAAPHLWLSAAFCSACLTEHSKCKPRATRSGCKESTGGSKVLRYVPHMSNDCPAWPALPIPRVCLSSATTTHALRSTNLLQLTHFARIVHADTFPAAAVVSGAMGLRSSTTSSCGWVRSLVFV